MKKLVFLLISAPFWIGPAQGEETQTAPPGYVLTLSAAEVQELYDALRGVAFVKAGLAGLEGNETLAKMRQQIGEQNRARAAQDGGGK